MGVPYGCESSIEIWRRNQLDFTSWKEHMENTLANQQIWPKIGSGGTDMMTVECAVSLGAKTLERLKAVVEHHEKAWQCMDKRGRDEMGMIRCLMHNAGVPKEQLGEMPYLQPLHLKAYLDEKERRRAIRQAVV